MTKALRDQVDKQRIFRTVMDLEGPKHPLDNPVELNEAALYIEKEMKAIGLKTEIQEFFIEGFEEPFKNVVGYLGDLTRPAIVLGSHYDTVRNSPGANDNASAVAVSLEVARVLSTLDSPPPLIVAAFTLEEGHPGMMRDLEDRHMSSGILDPKKRLTSPELLGFRKDIRRWRNANQSVRPLEAYRAMRSEWTSLSPLKVAYLDNVIAVYEQYVAKNPLFNAIFTAGSMAFVENLKDTQTTIEGLINLDCIGWHSEERNSQKKLPLSPDMIKMATTHRVDPAETIGNYVAAIGDMNSNDLFSRFMDQVASPEIDMPTLGLHIPADYKNILHMAPDVLRSDHSPFWMENIPGIFITDMANFRSDYYHTGADTYDNMNFDALVKVTQAIIAMLV